MKKELNIALVGNPNCGKTTIFNHLTGTRQHVANYSGVTVESKVGSYNLGDYKIILIDLPGVYSISSNSPEEEVVFRELCGGKIDLIINVLDATSLKRNLYLTTQVSELHIPMLLVFNMADEARSRGLKIDTAVFEQYFNTNIVKTTGTSHSCVKTISEALEKSIATMETHGVPKLPYGSDIEDSIKALSDKIDNLGLEETKLIPSRFFAIKLLEKDSATLKIPAFDTMHSEANAEIEHLLSIHAIESEIFIPDARYAMLSAVCKAGITFTNSKRAQISDKIDSVLINRVLGLPIFLAIMYLVFKFTFECADPLMGYVEDFFAILTEAISGAWSAESMPVLRSLVLDGVIGGVGGVIVFLPQIVLLFLALSILESSGYMSRAAFLMDGIMRAFGLQGKSFVPLIVGFGCTVPAIMATRTIESDTDRKTTIMVLPFMSCAARMPIYSLIIPAFFAVKYQALVMWVLYVIGIVVALIIAKLLKSTVFKGSNEIYLMELPPYRIPTLRNIFINMWEKAWQYLKKAGTVILAISIILFICNTYPEKTDMSKDYDSLISAVEADSSLGDEAKEEAVLAIEDEKLNEIFEYTISGRVGKFIEPVFAPLGFDWKISTATIPALAAKEVFVAQMGILYSLGDDEDEESVPLRENLRDNYSSLQAFCIMLFALLSIPCVATLAIIKKELGSWKYVVYESVGLFSVAWILTFIVYQVGSLFGL